MNTTPGSITAGSLSNSGESATIPTAEGVDRLGLSFPVSEAPDHGWEGEAPMRHGVRRWFNLPMGGTTVRLELTTRDQPPITRGSVDFNPSRLVDAPNDSPLPYSEVMGAIGRVIPVTFDWLRPALPPEMWRVTRVDEAVPNDTEKSRTWATSHRGGFTDCSRTDGSGRGSGPGLAGSGSRDF